MNSLHDLRVLMGSQAFGMNMLQERCSVSPVDRDSRILSVIEQVAWTVDLVTLRLCQSRRIKEPDIIFAVMADHVGPYEIEHAT